MQIIKGNKGGTAINALSFLFVLFLVVGAYMYLPITVKKMNLDALMGEATLVKGSPLDEEIIRAFIQEAERKHDIILFEEDVYIERGRKSMTLYVTWRPIMRIPLIGTEFELEKKLENERIRL